MGVFAPASRRLRVFDLPRPTQKRFLLADGRTPKLRAGSALSRTIFLARRLKPVWQGQEMAGILLPPSVAASLVNFAALLSGKIPVNLNYTVTGESLASCARQCQLESTLTSREFLAITDRLSRFSKIGGEMVPHGKIEEKLKSLWRPIPVSP
jgi:acyl-CoA synthetase (AMP-forming)/AMP-acid ligase II